MSRHLLTGWVRMVQTWLISGQTRRTLCPTNVPFNRSHPNWTGYKKEQLIIRVSHWAPNGLRLTQRGLKITALLFPAKNKPERGQSWASERERVSTLHGTITDHRVADGPVNDPLMQIAHKESQALWQSFNLIGCFYSSSIQGASSYQTLACL